MTINPPKLRERLFSKFLLLLIPVFAIVVMTLLTVSTQRIIQMEENQMAARVGSFAARTSAIIGNDRIKYNKQLTESYLGMLLSDDAIICAEITGEEGKLVASAPPHIGCKGQVAAQKIKIPMPRRPSETLTIQTSDAEIASSRIEKEYFSFIVLITGLLIAVATSWFGFRKFVSLPLREILQAIQTTSATGIAPRITNRNRDELGTVARAINDLHAKLAKEAQKNADALARINLIYNDTPALMLSINQQGTILKVSGYWLRVTGYCRSEVIGHNLADFESSKGPRTFLKNLSAATVETILKDEPFLLREKKGYVIDVTISATAENMDGETHYLCVMNDVSNLKATQKNLQTQATTDFLTNLPNRQGLFEYLEALDEKSAEDKQATAFLFIDLDGFKAVNDIYGHDAGDSLLKVASQRLRHSVKSTDFLARLGGDEFVIVLSNLDTYADTSIIAERILANFQAPFDISGKSVTVGTSIGISRFDQTNHTAEKALRMADLAMYTSKNAGKNRYAIYPNSLENETHSIISHLQ